MRTLFMIPVIVLMIAGVVFFVQSATSLVTSGNNSVKSNPSTLEHAIVTKIIDGDTIVIEGGEKVRLLGIDTRERGEKCYTEAKNYLKSLLEMKNVSLEKDKEDKDKYGRLLRYIWLDEVNINVKEVRELKYKNDLKEAESLARKDATGCLWK